MSRPDITAKAREYLGTPFQHQGRLKGVALDCVGLPVCVAEDLGLKDKNGVPFLRSDYSGYSAQPLDAFVFEEAKRRLIEKAEGSVIEEGDLLIMKVPKVPCHAAIATVRKGQLYMIHAYRGYATPEKTGGSCVEHIIDAAWDRRIAGAFSWPR